MAAVIVTTAAKLGKFIPIHQLVFTSIHTRRAHTDDSHSHNKSDCPNPCVFRGECRHCGKEGHMGKDCPSAPPSRCGNCRKEGHWIDECPVPLICPRCHGSHRVRDCTEPMKCRHCEGDHMARECPVYVPTCNNCGETGEFDTSKRFAHVPCLCATDFLLLGRSHRFRVQELPQNRSWPLARDGWPRGLEASGEGHQG